MGIDINTVEQVADLAKIALTDDEKAVMASELTHIMGWIEQLSAVDTDGVQPMTSVVELYQPLREDKVTDGNKAEEVLGNAPDRVGDFYAVPKVVE